MDKKTGAALIRRLAVLALTIVVALGAAAPRTARAQEAPDDISFLDHAGPGSNIVFARNDRDDRMLVRGSIELDRLHGENASPANVAEAFATCADCQTYAIALQIALVPRDAPVQSPHNYAVALNYQCTRCHTVARALQYVVPVDDPKDVPRDVSALIHAMDKEMHDISKDARGGGMTVDDAEARINAVINQFSTLAQGLYDQRQESTNPND